MYIDWSQLRNLALSELGKPYLFGSKPSIDNLQPENFDCSGFIRWVFGRIGIIIPEGSQEQFDVTIPVTNIQLGDLGFFKASPDIPTHHVGMILGPETVIEARGLEPSLETLRIATNRVLTRPVKNWEAWHEFTGWRRLKEVMK